LAVFLSSTSPQNKKRVKRGLFSWLKFSSSKHKSAKEGVETHTISLYFQLKQSLSSLNPLLPMYRSY
ncbi:hypothetical protein J0N09_08485, partial [Listeria monocytogenes]|nr:hypothetical protein [Listeria monocytogenes]